MYSHTLVTVSRYINAIIGGLTMAALLGSARRTACSARLACYLWHLHYESEYRYATSTAGSAARLPVCPRDRKREREGQTLRTALTETENGNQRHDLTSTLVCNVVATGYTHIRTHTQTH